MTDTRTAAAPSPVRTLVSQLTPMQVTARAVLRGAVIWGVVFGLVTWLEVIQFAREYPTAADRQRLVMMMGSNVGLDALFGPSPEIDTVGGYAATHAIGVLGIAGAIWALLAATRVLRGEEDAGRWEQLLAGATDRRRATAAAVGGLAIGYLVLWTLTAVLFAAAGSQGEARFSTSTVLFAATATTAAAGLFLAVGALCSQVAGNRRQAAALAAGIFVAAYLIRVVAYSTTSLRWLRWVTPLGWIDETHPFIRSHWPTLVAVAATAAALLTATIWLAGRRDLGAGLLPAHDTAPAHTRLLTGPLGLAVRLERASALGWAGGLALGGFLVGLIAKGSADIWANQTGGLFVALIGAKGGAIFLGICFLIMALLVTMAAAGHAAATREQEADGYLDHLLARPVDRRSWLAGRVAASAVTLTALGIIAGLTTWAGTLVTGGAQSVSTLLAAGINLIPVGILVLGIGTLTHAVAPRLTTTVSYGVVAWSFLLEVIGASLGLSPWLLDLSILHHLTRAPAEPVNWTTAVVLTTLGTATAGVGILAFTRRDIDTTA